jgi:hypothetical protein
MTQITLTSEEIKLIEIKREQDALEARKQEIAQQKVYVEKVASAKRNLINNVAQKTSQAKYVKSFYDELVKHGAGQYVLLKSETINVTAEDYYTRGLKIEDIPAIEQVIMYSIDTKWGSFYSITSDLKAHLPSGIRTSQYRQYSAKTATTKIKEQIDKETAASKEAIELKKAQEHFTSYFKSLDSNCTVKFTQEYVRNDYYGRRYNKLSAGYYSQRMEVMFTNGSFVKCVYYSDKSWIIKEKYDSKAIKLDSKEAWVEYLSK